ncbi:MAG TPA: hypothetical protein VHD15_14105, partial [Hyphomicrobiales bacterium]|nr:hypothetical protein [Hyphomicrobiales bacterium]
LRPRGAWFRAAAVALLLLALAGPSLTREDRQLLPNVLALVVDKSASQSFDHRAERTEVLRKALAEKAKALPGTELRTIEAGGTDGTELFKALAAGLADVPPDRVAGAILLTDGVVDDVPKGVADLGFDAPVHALITGRPNERDRRIVLTETPRFGIVGKPATIGFRIEETGVPASVSIPIAHAGPNVVELSAEAAPDELTDINNHAALTIEGVRDKLRVLLVSGEPHPGERTWRNLLKSDPNVDLVHFTILRPPEKQDGTPINELSLIAFPTRELFQTKLDQFDLIIFDRYARQGLLPMLYFQNIADYVRKGGAVLVAAGPDYTGPGALNDTPLGLVLPAEPTGNITEQPFRPTETTAGKRHPVTRDLSGGDSTPPKWSEWFRVVDTRVHGGDTLMTAAGNPLLVLAHEDQGRVALFLSDHIWLWARGYEGGGPYLELLRRMVHWLMKEPALEEEALRLSADAGRLTVERQTMADSAPPATLTAPSGKTTTVTLQPAEPGLFRATVEAGETGLWRARDGKFTALASVGPPNPHEFQRVASTTDLLKPIAEASGGSVRRAVDAEGRVAVPRLLAVPAGERASGDDWIGVREPSASVIRGLDVLPLMAGIVGLVLLIGALAATWAREGR